MARQEIIILKCDPHGSDKCEDIQTRSYVLEGTLYQIEAGAECVSEMTVGQIMDFGRKLGRNVVAMGSSRSASKPTTGTTADQKVYNAKVREWANRYVQHPKNGRIPEEVKNAHAANDVDGLIAYAKSKQWEIVEASKPEPVPAATFIDPSAEKALAEAAAIINGATAKVPAQKKAPARKAPAKKAASAK